MCVALHSAYSADKYACCRVAIRRPLQISTSRGSPFSTTFRDTRTHCASVSVALRARTGCDKARRVGSGLLPRSPIHTTALLARLNTCQQSCQCGMSAITHQPPVSADEPVAQMRTPGSAAPTGGRGAGSEGGCDVGCCGGRPPADDSAVGSVGSVAPADAASFASSRAASSFIFCARTNARGARLADLIAKRYRSTLKLHAR